MGYLVVLLTELDTSDIDLRENSEKKKNSRRPSSARAALSTSCTIGWCMSAKLPSHSARGSVYGSDMRVKVRKKHALPEHSFQDFAKDRSPWHICPSIHPSIGFSYSIHPGDITSRFSYLDQFWVPTVYTLAFVI